MIIKPPMLVGESIKRKKEEEVKPQVNTDEHRKKSRIKETSFRRVNTDKHRYRESRDELNHKEPKGTKRNIFNSDLDEILKRLKMNIQNQSRRSLLKVPVLILSFVPCFRGISDVSAVY